MSMAGLDRRCPGGLNPGRAGAKIRGTEHPPSSKTYDQWNNQTQLAMRHADTVRMHAEEILEKTSEVHYSTKNDNQTRHQMVHTALSKKIKTSQTLIKNLAAQIKVSETIIHKLLRSQATLKAQNFIEKPLRLCSQRQEMRAKRPVREQVRDPVEIGLEDEKETLLTSSDKLKSLVDRMEHMIASFKPEDLRFDEELKFHAMQLDIKCQKTIHRTWQVVDGKDNLALPPVAKGPYANWNVENEEYRQSECHTRISDSKEMEAAAQMLIDEIEETIQSTIAECQAAKDMVDKKLQESVQNIQSVRKRLTASMRDIDQKIELMRRSHLTTVREMRSHDEPFDLVAQKDGIRGSRKHREAITDPVSTALADHKAGLKQNHAELDRARAEVLQTIAMLEKAKTDIEHDLRDKTAALNIDLDCQQKNSAEQKMLFEMFLM